MMGQPIKMLLGRAGTMDTSGMAARTGAQLTDPNYVKGVSANLGGGVDLSKLVPQAQAAPAAPAPAAAPAPVAAPPTDNTPTPAPPPPSFSDPAVTDTVSAEQQQERRAAPSRAQTLYSGSDYSGTEDDTAAAVKSHENTQKRARRMTLF